MRLSINTKEDDFIEYRNAVTIAQYGNEVILSNPNSNVECYFNGELVAASHKVYLDVDRISVGHCGLSIIDNSVNNTASIN